MTDDVNCCNVSASKLQQAAAGEEATSSHQQIPRSAQAAAAGIIASARRFISVSIIYTSSIRNFTSSHAGVRPLGISRQTLLQRIVLFQRNFTL